MPISGPNSVTLSLPRILEVCIISGKECGSDFFNCACRMRLLTHKVVISFETNHLIFIRQLHTRLIELFTGLCVSAILAFLDFPIGYYKTNLPFLKKIGPFIYIFFSLFLLQYTYLSSTSVTIDIH